MEASCFFPPLVAFVDLDGQTMEGRQPVEGVLCLIQSITVDN